MAAMGEVRLVADREAARLIELQALETVTQPARFMAISFWLVVVICGLVLAAGHNQAEVWGIMGMFAIFTAWGSIKVEEAYNAAGGRNEKKG